jgi:hypothetical protein
MAKRRHPPAFFISQQSTSRNQKMIASRMMMGIGIPTIHKRIERMIAP